MRHTAALALTLALATSLGEPSLLAQLRLGGPAVRGTAGISGRVLVPDTNTPVREAEVIALNAMGVRMTATTDENGVYHLDRLPEGEWRVTASKGGFVSWQVGQRRPFETPPPITLARGQRLTADIQLTRGGAISGQVVDQMGEPIAGLQVRVYRARMERGARRLQPVGAIDLTDDRGTFRVYGLPPGDYYVGASLRVAPVDSVVETTYAPTYFPGTSDLGEAQRVRLGLGSEANATFALLPVQPARVSGIVMSSSGFPADAFLNLVSEAAELGMPVGVGGVTRADGTFTLTDVAPGRYILTATLRGDGPDESGSIPVTVAGGDLTGATVITGQPATLKGTIVAEEGVSRRPPSDLEVTAVSARPGGSVLGSGSGTSFEIASITEPFRLSVSGLPDDWGLSRMTVNGADATDTVVELRPGEQGQARIVLTKRLTEVSGTVAGADPSARVTIVIFPADASKWGPGSRHVRVAQTDGGGSFRVAGLPPGEQYLAVATDYLEDGEHTDPAFLMAMRDRAVTFFLDEREVRRIELPVTER